MPAKVILAVLCKSVSKDDEGYMTIHQVVDAAMLLDDGPPGVDLMGVVKLVADEPGEYPFRAAVVSENGVLASEEFRLPLELQPGLRTVVMDLQVQPVEAGFYWFEVEVGQEPVTRIPLAILWAPDSPRSR